VVYKAVNCGRTLVVAMHANLQSSSMHQERCGGLADFDGMRRAAAAAAPRPRLVPRRSRQQAVSNIAEISRIERSAADPATVKTTNRPKAWLKPESSIWWLALSIACTV
jgi:hypothetical protein